VKPIRCEPVTFEQHITVQTGEWQTEKTYCPGPIVQRCYREPGKWEFDACTCCSRYIPGPMVSCPIQMPGHWVCKKTFCPREEIRRVKCCKMVAKEHCEVVKYNVCKVVPVHTTRKCCYTMCKMVAEEHCKLVTRERCHMVPERK